MALMFSPARLTHGAFVPEFQENCNVNQRARWSRRCVRFSGQLVAFSLILFDKAGQLAFGASLVSIRSGIS
jgi:hypothetical protein